MKRILTALVGLFLFAATATAGTIAITGTIRTPNGNTFNGRIRFILSTATARDTSSDNLIVAQLVEFPVQNGSLPSTAKITPNDVLAPANTFYTAQYLSPTGALVAQNVFSIQGTTFNIGTAIPTPLTTSNISFSTLPALDSITSKNINNVRKCDQFSGSSAGAKIIACIADLPGTGGIADATGLEGAQTISATITLNKPVTLRLGAATYTMSAGINVTSDNVNIECSNGATLKRDTAFNSNMIVFSSSTTPTDGFRMTNCYVDGNKANTTAVNMSALIGVGATNFWLEDNWIVNSPGQGIGVGGVETGSVKTPASVGHIRNNVITGANDHSVDINGSHDIEIVQNIASDSPKTCFFFGHGDTYGLHVEGNTAHGCGTTPNVSDGDGFLFFNAPLFAETTTYYGLVVRGNISYSNYGAGFKIDSVTNSVFDGNIGWNNNQQNDQGAAWSGVSIDTQGGSVAPTGNIFSNNRFFDSQGGSSTQTCGIRENTGNNNFFFNNHLDGNKTCTILITGADSRADTSETNGSGAIWYRRPATTSGRFSVGDDNLYLDYLRDSATGVGLNFAPNDVLRYDRSSDTLAMLIGSADYFNITTAGVKLGQNGSRIAQNKFESFGTSCTTGASIGNSCTTTYSWTGTAWTDANYTAVCTVSNVASGAPAVIETSSKSTTQITLTISATTANAAQASAIDCIAFH